MNKVTKLWVPLRQEHFSISRGTVLGKQSY